MKDLKTCEKVRITNNAWRAANKSYFANYQANRNLNPIIRLRKNTSERLRYFLKNVLENKAVTKLDNTINEITGTSAATLRFYLLNQYFARYGTHAMVDFGKGIRLVIDHIQPIGAAQSLEDVQDLNFYMNLQLVREEDNIAKMQNDREIIQLLAPRTRKPRVGVA